VTDPGPSLSRRTDYGAHPLDEADAAADPLDQFAAWLTEAADRGVYEPNAMVVGTVDGDGIPSSRTVLLRALDERGFVFYTDRSSRKGRALAGHPVATVLFPWYSLHRQVIVTGDVAAVDDAESDAYWAGRPRGSRIAGSASAQSQPVSSRAELEARVRELEARYANDADVPRPDRWGGYRVRPWRMEFWQGRSSRLHDRLVYTRTPRGSDDWTLERLQP
jgi:pyridoxamine 5'-phosphate oxidase